MMFQPRSLQHVTALTHSEDLAGVYRDYAIPNSELISPKHSVVISPATKAFWQSSSDSGRGAQSIAIAGALMPARSS
jgi:hypothetical protein